jgi:AraC-like DNA-binding protein
MGILWIDFRMSRAKGYMRNNLEQPLRLGAIADEMGMSVSRFSHLFKSQTGLAPKQWLKRARIEKAARLLALRPELSIKEVAGEVCFNSSRLSREFRRQHGITPSGYRARAQAVSGGESRFSPDRDPELAYSDSNAG